ncbi:InlB B-repeat-containing protein [Faecalimonas umbilicata]|uniref:InlB B-repeat-containing protein n=1 Tax=Faecalimonas umbilicata TaxID=1912855 RepID=UPI00294264BA|nr:right-handed parallel beta-helix repeat-containing protein [Faecalimonas umbilicata]
MKHMKKRISCMILTATLLAGGSLEYAVAAEEQQNVSEIVTEEQVEIQSEEIVPQEEMVQTEEQAAATECQVVLETYTDGKLDEEHIGGTLTADKLSGHSGEWVTLTVKANHGYVFQRYDTNTDNLVTIDNNRFQLNEKFPTVVVKAYFTTREPGKDEVFFDDFGGEPGAALPEGVHISNGELVVDIPEGQGSNFYEPAIDWSQVSAQEGYRISVDVRRVTQTSGTMQIAFRGGEQSTQRYVVAINSQGSLMLRKIDGTNVELKKAAFQLTDQYAHIEVTVVKNEVRVSANGQELLAYTEQNNWGGMTPKVQLFNMTQGASMGFDNLLVEKICEKKPIEVVTIYNGQEDLEHRAGTAVSDVAEAKAGDTVTLQTIPKAGYRFKEYQVEGMESLSIVDNKFVMPAGEFEKLRVNAVFEDDTVREAKTFYVDSEGGNDQSAGTSEKEAWRTLGRIKEHNLFVPGDRILLKCGSVFRGEQLAFQGMGSAEQPIEISSYGEGELPRLEGNGEVENVISLYNQQYIHINRLEITNLDQKYNQNFELNGSNNQEKALRAINVSIRDFGTASDIRIEDCYIHDINGNIKSKWNGGIFFDVKANIQNGTLTGVPSKYDQILISGCTFERVDRSGIKLISSQWCNQWEKNDPGVPVNWYPSTNVVVRDNYMEKIGGDGITVRDTDGALIEHNLVRDCRYQNTGYNVGIWPFEAANTVLQYNEAYETHGTTDGQGLDCDHASSNSVMQYNYSHNNEGGFMLIMGGYPHTGATVRYNISQNDRDKTFEFAQGCPKGTMIYNNTIYSDQLLERGVFFLSNTGAGQGVNDTFAFNNVFHYPEGQKFYGGETQNLTTYMKLYNNAYTGGIEAFEGDDNPLKAEDAGLTAPGTGPEVNESKTAVTGSSGALDGYQLEDTSVLIDKGITVEEAWKHFGGTELVDGRGMSPRDLFEQAKNGNSIDYVVGNNFPQINGVGYDKDFFGNSLADGKPDIGAAEFLASVPEQPDPEQPNPEQPNPEQPNPEQPSPEKPNPEQPKPEQPKPDGEKPNGQTDQKPSKGESVKTGDPVVVTGLILLLIVSGGSIMICFCVSKRNRKTANRKEN